jgi:hypothetical protein
LRTCDPFTAMATMAEVLFASPLPTTEHDMHAPISKDRNINLQATMASGGRARDFYGLGYGDVRGTRVGVVGQSETEKETKINLQMFSLFHILVHQPVHMHGLVIYINYIFVNLM